MQHKFPASELFAEVTVDKMAARSVLVRPCKTSHNIQFQKETPASTSVYVLGGGLVGRVIHAARNNNVERPVQSPSWRAQPLDFDADRPPFSLEALLVPFVDRLQQVERFPLAEVQTSPWHPSMVAP